MNDFNLEYLSWLISRKPKRVVEPIAWVQHIPFAFWTINMLKPTLFVELGVHTGNSFSAFCQAIKELNIKCSAYGIDTFKGDKHAGFYGDEIFQDINDYINKEYSDFAQLMKMSFDEGLVYFSDYSIDLLHIDGLHAYEAIKHDFEKWLPKMSKKGVILFHDTVVRRDGFGIWKFWEEVRDKYTSLEFTHGYGLGVLIVGTEAPDEFKKFLTYVENNSKLQDIFSYLGSTIEKEHSITIKDQHIANLEQSITTKDQHIANLEQSITTKDQHIANLEQSITTKDQHITNLEQSITTKDQHIANLEQSAQARDQNILSLQETVSTKNQTILSVEKMIRKKDSEINKLNSIINNVYSSIFWKLWNTYAGIINTILPKGSKRRRVYIHIRQLFKGKKSMISDTEEKEVEHNYTNWVKLYDTLNEKDRANIRTSIDNFTKKPLVTIIMPVCNTDGKWLLQAIESVRMQLYPQWELCITYAASIKHYARILLRTWSIIDKRIKIKRLNRNESIAGASNVALSMATGDYVVLMDYDSELAEHALYHVVLEINSHPDAELIYSDEDKIDNKGYRFDPYFKPDWNPDLFLCQNMISHLGVYRTVRVRNIGGFREGFEGAENYDLTLRFIQGLNSKHIHHIPRVLYHQKNISISTELNVNKKGYATIATQQAVQEYLDKQGIPASVEVDPIIGFYQRVHYRLPEPAPLVSIIIPTRDGFNNLHRCVESIYTKTRYPHYELIIVDNQSKDPQTLKYMKELAALGRAQILSYPHTFNYSAINNLAVHHAKGDVLCLLNDDTEIISEEWLEEMVSQAIRPEIGVVGAKLFYEDGRIQHAGVIIGIAGVAGHAYRFRDRKDTGYWGRCALVQNLSAVTGACMVVRRSLYLKVGGMETEHLKVAWNDIDFCLRLLEAGYRNLWTPYAELFHCESVTRGYDATPEKQEIARHEMEYMRQRWGTATEVDPAYNPNLTLNNEDFGLAWPPRLCKPWHNTKDDSTNTEKPLFPTKNTYSNVSTAAHITIALLTYRLSKGYGVDVVVAKQIKYFLSRGYRLIVIAFEGDDYSREYLAKELRSGKLVALKVASISEIPNIIERYKVSITIAHTPPFYFILNELPKNVLKVIFDYGEPPVHFFPDWKEREEINKNKYLSALEADLVISISNFIKSESKIEKSHVLWLGNDHFQINPQNMLKLESIFRKKHNIGDKFIVLNVTRFFVAERLYKGVDKYIEVKNLFYQQHPDLRNKVIFILIGRANDEDILWAKHHGLHVYANLSNEELIEAYADADFYLSMSQWEGYNLGIAQALAFGIDVAASDQGAHREFGIPVSNNIESLVKNIYESYTKHGRLFVSQKIKNIKIFPWEKHMVDLETLILNKMISTNDRFASNVITAAKQKLHKLEKGEIISIGCLAFRKKISALIEMFWGR